MILVLSLRYKTLLGLEGSDAKMLASFSRNLRHVSSVLDSVANHFFPNYPLAQYLPSNTREKCNYPRIGNTGSQ